MKRLYILLMVCCLGLCNVSFAQTIDTEHSNTLGVKYLGTLQNRDMLTIRVSGKNYSMSPGCIMYDIRGYPILKINWPTEWENIRYQLDLYSQIHRVWLLEDD